MPRRRLSPEAQKAWKALAPQLADLGLLTAVDAPSFELMCEHYAVAVQAARQLRKDGLTQTDDKGLMHKHPAAQIFREASAAFRMYAEQFGLTPSARSRMRLDLPGEQMTLADVLFAGVDDYGPGDE